MGKEIGPSATSFLHGPYGVGRLLGRTKDMRDQALPHVVIILAVHSHLMKSSPIYP